MKSGTSVRSRLTLYNAGIFFIITVVFAAGILLIMNHRLKSMMDDQLDLGFDTVASILENSGGDIFDIMHLSQTDHFMVSQDSVVAYETEAWFTAGLTEAVDDARADPDFRWKGPGGELFQLRVDSIPRYGFEVSYARDVSAAEESLRNLITVLFAGVPVVLVLGLLGGYFLAGRALAPVQSITDKAREIGADSLSARLPVMNPRDEFGKLSTVFNDTLERLERSFNQLRQFTADASHEMRTPLTSMRSVGQVALKDRINETACRDAVGSMLEDVDRLSELLDNLLMLAAGDSGRIKPDVESRNLGEYVGAIAEELRILAEERTIDLCIDTGITRVPFDDRILRHGLVNVIHNAIRYSPTGGTVHVRVADVDGSYAIIEVDDEGSGIPETERELVFQRFYRIDKARSRAEGGMGLGLALAKWAVELHGGTIEFIDKKGPGSRCRITLPKHHPV